MQLPSQVVVYPFTAAKVTGKLPAASMPFPTDIILDSSSPLTFSELSNDVEEACLFEGKPDFMFKKFGFTTGTGRPDPATMETYLMHRVPGTRDLRPFDGTSVETLLELYNEYETGEPIDIVVVFNTDIKVTGAAAAAETHGTDPVVLLVKGPLPCHQLIDKLIQIKFN